VRAVRVETDAGTGDDSVLELSGWPVAGGAPPVARVSAAPPYSSVVDARLTSSLTGVAGFTTASIRRMDGLSPLGEYAAVPVLRTSAAPQAGEVYVALVVLHGLSGSHVVALPRVTVTRDGRSDLVEVHWPDGRNARMTLPDPRNAAT
jgi:hypothetical protein